MNKRWSDFLFAIIVRLLCGSVIGGLAGLLIGYRLVLEKMARDNNGWVLTWLSAWAVGGAAVAIYRIPHWQRPGYKGISESNDEGDTGPDYNFKRVAPQLYNRRAHPSLKQFHDFVRWLQETTIADLERTRGDLDATKAAFVLFFRRGLKADLLLSELTELLPSIVSNAGYSEAEHSEVVAMLTSLDLRVLGFRSDEKGLHFDDQGA